MAMVLLLDSIVTPPTIHRYSVLNDALGGQLEVWYQWEREPYRIWFSLPSARFGRTLLGHSGIENLWNLMKRLQQQGESLDLVIIRGWNTPVYLYTVWWCQRHHVPMILWSGSTVWERHWVRQIVEPIVRWVVESASCYLAYGTRAKEYLISLGAQPEKIALFWNSVDLEPFSKARGVNRQKARKVFGLSTDRRIVLFVGQLIDRKNVIALTEAFRIVQSRHPELHLVIAGFGPLGKKIPPHPEITVVGHVEYQDLPQLYRTADAFILPSKEEVWGLVVNEAMAAGVPCAVSVTAGVAEDLVFTGKTGWRILPTVNGIRKALEVIAKTPPGQLKKMGRKAAERVQQTEHSLSARRLFKLRRDRTKLGE